MHLVYRSFLRQQLFRVVREWHACAGAACRERSRAGWLARRLRLVRSQCAMRRWLAFTGASIRDQQLRTAQDEMKRELAVATTARDSLGRQLLARDKELDQAVVALDTERHYRATEVEKTR